MNYKKAYHPLWLNNLSDSYEPYGLSISLIHVSLMDHHSLCLSMILLLINLDGFTVTNEACDATHDTS